MAETLVYIYKTEFNTKVKIIRPFNVYGPNMPPHDNRVIPKMYKTIVKKKLGSEILGEKKPHIQPPSHPATVTPAPRPIARIDEKNKIKWPNP